MSVILPDLGQTHSHDTSMKYKVPQDEYNVLELPEPNVNKQSTPKKVPKKPKKGNQKTEAKKITVEQPPKKPQSAALMYTTEKIDECKKLGVTTSCNEIRVIAGSVFWAQFDKEHPEKIHWENMYKTKYKQFLQESRDYSKQK